MPFLAVISVIIFKQKAFGEIDAYQQMSLLRSLNLFSLLQMSEVVFFLGIYMSHVFSEIRHLRACGTATVCQFVHLFAILHGLLLQCVLFSKIPELRVRKLSLLIIMDSLKTPGCFYSICCNVLNMRITTALCWCQQEELLLVSSSRFI